MNLKDLALIKNGNGPITGVFAVDKSNETQPSLENCIPLLSLKFIVEPGEDRLSLLLRRQYPRSKNRREV